MGGIKFLRLGGTCASNYTAYTSQEIPVFIVAAMIPPSYIVWALPVFMFFGSLIDAFPLTSFYNMANTEIWVLMESG
jgi:hypothetical protein